MGHKPVHLVFVEEKNKGDGVDHNKFYDMFEKDGKCYCYWGRRQDGYEFGKSGKITVKSLSEWDKIYSQKVGKGYEDFSYLYEDLVVAEDVNKSDSSKDSIYAPIENKNIEKIVERLQKAANRVITQNYSVSSGAVTKVMVEEVQDRLNEMAKITNGQNVDIDLFNDSLLGIFKVIPRSMARVDKYLAQNQNELAGIIAREQALLDIMRGQIYSPVRGQKVITADGNKKTILQLNGINFEEVDDKDIKLIKSRMGSRSDLFVNAWRVSNDKQSKAYSKYCAEEHLRKKDCKLLWHGTRSENVWNILKTGLVLRPTNAVITGHMLGQGLYFAPDFLKSHNYTSARGTTWAGGTQDTGFMILHAVAYGTPYDVTSFNEIGSSFNYNDLEKLSLKNGKKYNCVHAHKGMNTGWSSLRADEIVVYKEDQIMPLYLVEVR